MTIQFVHHLKENAQFGQKAYTRMYIKRAKLTTFQAAQWMPIVFSSFTRAIVEVAVMFAEGAKLHEIAL